jgi:hypothetical protein
MIYSLNELIKCGNISKNNMYISFNDKIDSCKELYIISPHIIYLRISEYTKVTKFNIIRVKRGNTVTLKQFQNIDLKQYNAINVYIQLTSTHIKDILNIKFSDIKPLPIENTNYNYENLFRKENLFNNNNKDTNTMIFKQCIFSSIGKICLFPYVKYLTLKINVFDKSILVHKNDYKIYTVDELKNINKNKVNHTFEVQEHNIIHHLNRIDSVKPLLEIITNIKLKQPLFYLEMTYSHE